MASRLLRSRVLLQPVGQPLFCNIHPATQGEQSLCHATATAFLPLLLPQGSIGRAGVSISKSNLNLPCQIRSPGASTGGQAATAWLPPGWDFGSAPRAHLCLLWLCLTAGLATTQPLLANRCGWLGLAQHHSPHLLTTTCHFPQLFLALPGEKKRWLLDQEPGSASQPEQGKPGVVGPPVQ